MKPPRSVVTILVTALCCIISPRCWCDEIASSSGQRHALIIWGLSGDGDHHQLYSQTVETLLTGLEQRLAISADAVQLVVGDEPRDDDPVRVREAPRATKEGVTEAIQAFKAKVQPEDSVWVIVLGHTHYDGRFSWLNLPGPDLQHAEFATLFDGLTAQEQVFVLTTSTSGVWIKNLSAKNRVILTATEAGWETNETEYPHELARLMAATDLTTAELDTDLDGKFSLFDLHLKTVGNLAKSYFDGELLATEHGQLDDDGDGRGTELQIDFLTIDLGGRLQPNRPFEPPVISKGDGVLAKTIVLHSVATIPDAPPVDALDVYPPRE